MLHRTNARMAVVALAMGFVLMATSWAYAANIQWVGDVDDLWLGGTAGVNTNWSNDDYPVHNDNARIGGASSLANPVTIQGGDLIPDDPGHTDPDLLGHIWLGGNASQMGTAGDGFLKITGGTVNLATNKQFHVGADGYSGWVEQTGGDVNGGDFNLRVGANGPGEQGTYLLKGGTLNVGNRNADIGRTRNDSGGVGVFEQSGGTFLTASDKDLNLGTDSNATADGDGSYTLTGGGSATTPALDVDNLNIGRKQGPGAVNPRLAGTGSVLIDISVARDPGVPDVNLRNMVELQSGSFELKNGIVDMTVNNGKNFKVATEGDNNSDPDRTAILTVSGGVLNIEQHLNVGTGNAGNNSSGTVNIFGGQINTGAAAGGTGGGNFDVRRGTVTQTGGDVDLYFDSSNNGNLDLATGENHSATYTMTGGSVEADQINVATGKNSTATLSFTGDTLTAHAAIDVATGEGSDGTFSYNKAGGSLGTGTGSLNIATGNTSTGTFTFTGEDLAVGNDLQVGTGEGSLGPDVPTTGSFTYNGGTTGTLSVGAAFNIGRKQGPGAVNVHGAGTGTVVIDTQATGSTIGGNVNLRAGSFDLSNGTLTLTGNGKDFAIATDGDAGSDPNRTATLTLTNAVLNIEQHLQVGSGTADNDTAGTVLIDGSQINTGAAAGGTGGGNFDVRRGTVTQTGGDVDLYFDSSNNGNLDLATGENHSATYTMTGGSVEADQINVATGKNSTATLSFTGDTLTAHAAIDVATGEGSDGTFSYNKAGGSLGTGTGSLNIATGNTSTGTFTFTGEGLAVGNELKVGTGEGSLGPDVPTTGSFTYNGGATGTLSVGAGFDIGRKQGPGAVNPAGAATGTVVIDTQATDSTIGGSVKLHAGSFDLNNTTLTLTGNGKDFNVASAGDNNSDPNRTATLTLTNAVLNVEQHLQVGSGTADNDGAGTVLITGSQINTGAAAGGAGGGDFDLRRGTVTQTGGAVDLFFDTSNKGNLLIATGESRWGSYEISGGTLEAFDLNMGRTQGDNVVANTQMIVDGTSAPTTVTLQGDLDLRSGTFDLRDGTVDVLRNNKAVKVGSGGGGGADPNRLARLILRDGALNVDAGLNIGNGSQLGTGIVEIYDASLTTGAAAGGTGAGHIDIRNGSITQTGGAVDLVDDALTGRGDLLIASEGSTRKGTYDISTGSLEVGEIKIGRNQNDTLEDPKLIVQNAATTVRAWNDVDLRSGSFELKAGTVDILDESAPGPKRNLGVATGGGGLADPNRTARFSMTGGVMNIDQDLTVGSDGTWNGGAGIYNTNGTGTVDVSDGTLTIGVGASANGTFNIRRGTVAISGGTVSCSGAGADVQIATGGHRDATLSISGGAVGPFDELKIGRDDNGAIGNDGQRLDGTAIAVVDIIGGGATRLEFDNTVNLRDSDSAKLRETIAFNGLTPLVQTATNKDINLQANGIYDVAINGGIVVSHTDTFRALESGRDILDNAQFSDHALWDKALAGDTGGGSPRTLDLVLDPAAHLGILNDPQAIFDPTTSGWLNVNNHAGDPLWYDLIMTTTAGGGLEDLAQWMNEQFARVPGSDVVATTEGGHVYVLSPSGLVPDDDSFLAFDFTDYDGLRDSETLVYGAAQMGVLEDVIPEPATLALVGVGLLALLRRRRKR